MSTYDKAVAMIGQSYKYRGEVINIIDVKDIDGITTEVVTNKKDYQFTIGELSRFVENCAPTGAVPAAIPQKPTQLSPVDQQVNAMANLVSEMTEVLHHDIKKVGDDPGYIAQAKQRGNNVNSLINLMKVGISLQKK